jgi:hypothetical protein
MNPLKTPKEKLLEEAGAMPASPGLIKTPKQMLVEESGITPKFAKGKKVKKLSVKDMEAELAAAGRTPPRLKKGGKTKRKK